MALGLAQQQSLIDRIDALRRKNPELLRLIEQAQGFAFPRVTSKGRVSFRPKLQTVRNTHLSKGVKRLRFPVRDGDGFDFRDRGQAIAIGGGGFAQAPRLAVSGVDYVTHGGENVTHGGEQVTASE